MNVPEVNRTITDFRALLRLGGVHREQAIRQAVDAYRASEYGIGKTAKALGLSRSTFERARSDYPALSDALRAAEIATSAA